MGHIPYFDILILAMIAVFILNRLKNVLGKKTGEEPNRNRELHLNEKDYSESKPDKETNKSDEVNKKDNLIAFHEDKKINLSLNEIHKLENKFDIEDFVDKARKAFEYILKAYSKNNLKSLETLLDKELFLEYKKDITSRIKKKQFFEITIIGVKKPVIVDSKIKDKDAQISVKYQSEQIHVTKNSSGEIIEGDVNQILTIQEIWTFSRKLKSRNPNWSLQNISEV
ncbi:Tim44/TimA family putative adaptor protein [Rickettsiales bacterium]|nr:Tim44/TimA family putative adaptor protein [Rickettsiales bacterium]